MDKAESRFLATNLVSTLIERLCGHRDENLILWERHSWLRLYDQYFHYLYGDIFRSKSMGIIEEKRKPTKSNRQIASANIQRERSRRVVLKPPLPPIPRNRPKVDRIEREVTEDRRGIEEVLSKRPAIEPTEPAADEEWIQSPREDSDRSQQPEVCFQRNWRSWNPRKAALLQWDPDLDDQPVAPQDPTLRRRFYRQRIIAESKEIERKRRCALENSVIVANVLPEIRKQPTEQKTQQKRTQQRTAIDQHSAKTESKTPKPMQPNGHSIRENSEETKIQQKTANTIPSQLQKVHTAQNSTATAKPKLQRNPKLPKLNVQSPQTPKVPKAPKETPEEQKTEKKETENPEDPSLIDQIKTALHRIPESLRDLFGRRKSPTSAKSHSECLNEENTKKPKIQMAGHFLPEIPKPQNRSRSPKSLPKSRTLSPYRAAGRSRSPVVEWPLAHSFTPEVGRCKIIDYIEKSWEYPKAALNYRIEHRHADRHSTQRHRFKYRVRWTAQKDAKEAVVHFNVDVSRADPTAPIELSYRFAGQPDTHRAAFSPTATPFRRRWLKALASGRPLPT